MWMKIYILLVNKHSGIREKYHRCHDKASGMKKLWSYFYLLGLNIMYILGRKELDYSEMMHTYEEKKLLLHESESSAALQGHLSYDEYVTALSEYDVISFDIFDTLIFRPFSKPTDLFYLIGQRLGMMNFTMIRQQAEYEARLDAYAKTGSYEITLVDIWKKLSDMSGILAEAGMKIESELEAKFCYANPFMQRVYQEMMRQGKKLVITSDMYLPKELLEHILVNNGYQGFEKLYVSCEYGCNKGTGKLFEIVQQDQVQGTRIAHLGDNRISDINQANARGMKAFYYPNVTDMGDPYRAEDMSCIIGGVYRGIVNNYLYCGDRQLSMDYEYGYIYGGLFVLGYCHFIHEYCMLHQIDKVLFLSRDGDILHQVYRRMYPEECVEYVYWSRKAATKLMASSDWYDYIRRFIDHKVNQQIPMSEILGVMEIPDMLEGLSQAYPTLQSSTYLTDKNATDLKAFLLTNRERVLAHYHEEHEAAQAYYTSVLTNHAQCLAVDIGWAGSGAIALNHLVTQVWNLPCHITGMIAGSNTLHNSEPYASEMFMQDGELVSYLYSMSHNRDLMKKHDPNKNYNVYWELLLSSPTKKFNGFSWVDESKQEIQLNFGSYDFNVEGIKEIQQGILDFVEQYMAHFGDTPCMLNISGRDAYAPMLVAASHNEKYLKEIEKRFKLEVNVN